MVCSGGGHLRQLYDLAERIGVPESDQYWVTFRNGQSESLLAGRTVEYIPFTAPRDYAQIARMHVTAARLLRRHRFTTAISTGSSPAAAFLPLAVAHGVSCHYIESAARAEGPSVTGRLLARVPKVNTYTQYPSWQSSRWSYQGSIFDRYEPGPHLRPEGPIRRAVVSLGTQEGYPFPRLVNALAPLLRQADEVLWQVGALDTSPWGVAGTDSLPHRDLSAAMASADVVVCHAGTGSAITALEAGKHPILVPRSAHYGEHVDDHQNQIAAELARRGLATPSTPETLTSDDLQRARERSTLPATPPPFQLLDLHMKETP